MSIYQNVDYSIELDKDHTIKIKDLDDNELFKFNTYKDGKYVGRVYVNADEDYRIAVIRYTDALVVGVHNINTNQVTVSNCDVSEDDSHVDIDEGLVYVKKNGMVDILRLDTLTYTHTIPMKNVYGMLNGNPVGCNDDDEVVMYTSPDSPFEGISADMVKSYQGGCMVISDDIGRWIVLKSGYRIAIDDNASVVVSNKVGTIVLVHDANETTQLFRIENNGMRVVSLDCCDVDDSHYDMVGDTGIGFGRRLGRKVALCEYSTEDIGSGRTRITTSYGVRFITHDNGHAGESDIEK